MVLSLKKLGPPSHKDALCQVWLQLAKWFWRERFLDFVNVFSLFRIMSLGKRWGPSFEQTWIPFTRGCIVPSLVEIDPVVLEEKIFKFRQCIFAISSMSFRYFATVSLWQGRGFSFEQTWISFTQWCIVLSLVEIRPMVLEKKIIKFRQCFFAILYWSPLGKGWDPSIEQNESQSPKNALCRVWLAQVS